MRRRYLDLDNVRQQQPRQAEPQPRWSEPADSNHADEPVTEGLRSVAHTTLHVIKRQFAQQFRDVPVLGEIFMGHVEDEAEDPDANIPRGVRETTHAEILGDKLRRTWRRFTKE